ncbi:MAG TPA: tryptophan 7-halogenase, partial [Woeseiaceae bacterium]
MIEASAAQPSSQRIVIVGGGVAAWMAATALAKAVRLGDWSIRVVGDDAAASLAPYDVADATLPLPR